MPPEEKPEGDVVWIGGYWAWDDDRDDFLWVVRLLAHAAATGKEWVAGYWREQARSVAVGARLLDRPSQEEQGPNVTYYPEPPPPPAARPARQAARGRPVLCSGLLDVGRQSLRLAGRLLEPRPSGLRLGCRPTTAGRRTAMSSSPATGTTPSPNAACCTRRWCVDAVVVGPRSSTRRTTRSRDTIVVDALFVRPGRCHYYFGDYYGPRYVGLGFHCGYHYSRLHYDPIIVYNRWAYRDSPGWFDVRLSISLGRSAGRVPCPPRTLVQQVNVTNVRNVNRTVINNTTVNNNVANTQVLAPAKNVMASKGVKTVKMDAPARARERDNSQQLRTAVVKQRQDNERVQPGIQANNKPRSANLNLPPNAARAKNMERIRPAADERGPGKQPGIRNAADPRDPRDPRNPLKNPARIDDDRPNAKPRPIGSGTPNVQPRPNTVTQPNRPPAAKQQPPPRPAPRQSPPPRKNDDKKGR